MTNIAESIVAKMGGADALASLLGLERTTVYRWTYEKEKGGTDGLIPAKYHGPLLRLAQENGIELEPSDFFDLSRGHTASAEGH